MSKEHTKILIPAELYHAIIRKRRSLQELRAHGKAVSYPQFVSNLFKEMESDVATVHHAATGVAGEGGELLDATKKSWVYEKPLDVENIIEELGDLYFYFQKFLNMLGLEIEDIQAANIIKLEKRYPEGIYTNEYAQARLDKKGESDA